MWITSLTERFVRVAAITVVAALVASAASAQHATYEVISSFQPGDGRPNGVIQTRDGRFYGTTAIAPPPSGSLQFPSGTVFAMDASGARTTLHTFFTNVTTTDFQGTPQSNLVEGTDGNLYGTTYNLASSPIDPGHIFRITPDGIYTRLSGLYELRAGLIRARDGRLYGTADGTHNASFPTYGSVFRLDTSLVFTSVHTFSGRDTAYPVSELVETDDGSLYGTTTGGRVYTANPPPLVPGAIFRIDPISGAYSIRHLFPEGTRPIGKLIQGTDGLIYGTTVDGGDSDFGTVFSLDPAGTLTTLHHFSGTDGREPNAGVIQGLDGRLYGTTTVGGTHGFGTVFVMNVTGGLTTLHHFDSARGANPLNELIQANDGSFYGAAWAGGPGNTGVIFRVTLSTTPPGGGYVEIVSRHSGKCLDVAGGSTVPGAPVLQWSCHGGANQQWRLEPAGGGAMRIISRHSGQALDVAGGSTVDGAAILQWPVHGGDNQAWTLEPAADGYVRLVVRHSGKAMDVEFGSTVDGARVLQWSPHNGANQQWLIRSSSGITP